jgi:TolB protein
MELPSLKSSRLYGWSGGWIGLVYLMGLTCLVDASPVFAEPAPAPIVITPGEGRAFRAAVQTFHDRIEPVDPERAKALRSEIEEGMRFSSILLPLAPEAFTGEEVSSKPSASRRGDCADWAVGGADALVEGSLQNAGQELELRYQVWDIARCKRLARGHLRGPHGERRRLARQLADEVVGAFTGTPGVAATEIAFISNRSGAREVYVMDADGARQRAATRGASIKAFPDWTPDGLAILYTSYANGVKPSLYLTSRGEYAPGMILSDVLDDLPKYRGVFDPRGEELALVASLDGASEIYRVSRKGRRLRRLTHSPAIEISPAWSPDGKRIAFVSDRSGSPQIYLMNRRGGDVRRLTFNGSYNTSPTWSPDGRWIAYETRVEGQFDIWLIDPSGETNFPVIVHPRSDESPAWSPDSRKLIFSSRRRGRSDLYVIDVNGDNLRRLTRGQGENIQPAWGPHAP